MPIFYFHCHSELFAWIYDLGKIAHQHKEELYLWFLQCNYFYKLGDFWLLKCPQFGQVLGASLPLQSTQQEIYQWELVQETFLCIVCVVDSKGIHLLHLL